MRIDGFLAPTGDRRANTYTAGMYSGKRHRCGFNIQVVGSADGRLVLVGDPQAGAMHDARAWTDSGLAARFAGRLHADDGPGGFADTAYIATGLTTPRRKTAGTQRTESEIEFNRARLPTRQRGTGHRPRQELETPGQATAACSTSSRAPGCHRQTRDLQNIMIVY